MNPTQAFVALGSNIEPSRNIPAALGFLREYCPVRSVSSVYVTEPIGEREQPEFRNGMLLLEWSGTPHALKFDVLRRIEEQLGRERGTDKYMPRTMDLDIVLFGDRIVNDRDLCIPDPEIKTRAFLAKGLLDIDADVRLPDTGEWVRDLPIVRNTHGIRVDEALTRTLKENTDGC